MVFRTFAARYVRCVVGWFVELVFVGHAFAVIWIALFILGVLGEIRYVFISASTFTLAFISTAFCLYHMMLRNLPLPG